MASLLNTFNALDLRKKIVLALAVVATLALVLFVARGATQPTMALLYGGLDAKAAGEVVGALEQMGVKTDVRGDAIFVPVAERDRARLTLAKQGLPAQGQAGYELLDGLSGFGTTSEMFEAAYWRAKEGELARTIGAVPGVRSARVHIGASARRPFARSSNRSTAAVTVTTAGGPLSAASALSMRYLVALAVADLDPAQVAVIDARHGVVLRPGEERASQLADQNSERRSVRLKEELERLLAVRVGDGNVRISVAVETTTESETLSEKIIDPDSRVTMTANTEELSEDLAGGSTAVTVASNLPDGDTAGGAAGDNRSKRTQAKETVSYSYSETKRNRIKEAGAIKRIGVAVLVNEVQEVQEDGAIANRPRSPQELSAIEDLVKSAIAFNAERGDVVTVESMAFAKEPERGSEAEIGLIEQVLANHLVELIQGLVLALVAIALGLFVVRPILTSAASAQEDEEAAKLEADQSEDAPALAGPDGQPLPAAVVGPDGAPIDGAALPTPEGSLGAAALATVAAAEGAVALAENDDKGSAGANLLDQLRGSVEGKRDESVQLLKRWLHMTAEQSEAEEVR